MERKELRRGRNQRKEKKGCEAQEETGKGQLALDIRKGWQITPES